MGWDEFSGWIVHQKANDSCLDMVHTNAGVFLCA